MFVFFTLQFDFFCFLFFGFLVHLIIQSELAAEDLHSNVDVQRSEVTVHTSTSQSRVLKTERVSPSSHAHPRDQLQASLHFAISLHFDIVCAPLGRTTGRERTAPRR